MIMHWDEEASWVGDEFRWFGTWKGWWSFWTSRGAWISRVVVDQGFVFFLYISRMEIERRFAMTKAYQDILLYVNDRSHLRQGPICNPSKGTSIIVEHVE